MAAANTDKFKKAKRRFSTTVDVSGFAQGATTLNLTTTTGLDTDTAITLVIDPGLATEEVITGVVSGSDVINCVRGKEGTTDQAHTAGAVVTMYFTETHWDDLIDGVLVEHNQNGSHGAITATSVSVDGVSVVSPAGSVMQYAGSSAPSGWLLADGTAVSRTTYAALYAVIGTTYGVGDNSTTFNLPNLKGKVPVGRDSSDTSFDVLGETGGAKTHTLTTAEMPAHTHELYANVGNAASATNLDDITGSNNINATDVRVGDRPTTTTGGGGAHNNLQPYIVLNYIIKT
jgi:microcystin-dependent protein